MARLIFHIGFPKCGSTTIYRSFAANLRAMRQQKIFVFNSDFELARAPSQVKTPLWEIQKARTSREHRQAMRSKLHQQIKQAPKNSTLILSSEVLGVAGTKAMFTRFDEFADAEVIAYFRPQVDWIPSAWKQWDSRVGDTLQDATARYIETHRPGYRQMIEKWESFLPNAKTTLRLFARGALVNGDPFEDFMTQIGFEHESLDTLKEVLNPSIDYALLHLMMCHYDLFFASRNDSRLMSILVKRLPSDYLKTNAVMLNTQMTRDITEAFRADNIHMLSRSRTPELAQADFDTYFTRPPVAEGSAYPDYSEDHILSRAADILKETIEVQAQDTSNKRRALAVALQGALTDV